MMSDNFHFDLTGVPMDAAVAIATQHNAKAVAWRVEEVQADGEQDLTTAYGAAEKRPRLILYWVKPSNKSAHSLPPISQKALPGFIESWLESIDYGPSPDIDGSVKKGFRMYNEAWGHVAEEWEAFVAVEPVWLMYGK